MNEFTKQYEKFHKALFPSGKPMNEVLLPPDYFQQKVENKQEGKQEGKQDIKTSSIEKDIIINPKESDLKPSFSREEKRRLEKLVKKNKKQEQRQKEIEKQRKEVQEKLNKLKENLNKQG